MVNILHTLQYYDSPCFPILTETTSSSHLAVGVLGPSGYFAGVYAPLLGNMSRMSPDTAVS